MSHRKASMSTSAENADPVDGVPRKLQRPQQGTLNDFADWIRKLKQSCSLNYLASTTHERDNQKRPEKSREKYEKYQDDQHQRGDNTGQKNKQRSHQGDAKPKLVLIHRHITEDTQEKCLLECNDRAPHTFDACERFKNASQPERFLMIQKHQRCPFCCGPHKFRNCSRRQATLTWRRQSNQE